MKQITTLLFKPIDPASLVMFRFVFGILLISDMMNTLLSGVINDLAASPVQFTYYGFQWIPIYSGLPLTAIVISGCLGALLFTAGRFYYLGVALMTATYAYLFLVEKSLYLNHGYLTILLCLLCFFVPLHRYGKVGTSNKPAPPMLGWHLFVFCFSMGIAYFFGGIAKINPDWLNAMPLAIWLPNVKNPLFFAPFINELWFAYFISYGGLLFDLTIVFFLLIPKTRTLAFTAAIFFHFSNHVFFNIGTFPWLSLMLTAMFFPPSFPREIPYLGKIFQKQLPLQTEPARYPRKSTKQEKYVLLGLSIFVAFHFFMPLRHHLYKGNVAWTDEAHRYSWRMMLRSKQGAGYFMVENEDGSKQERVWPRSILNSRQHRKMMTHPDMILQMSHYLRDKYQDEWNEPVKVFAFIQCSLNGRPRVPYINPEIDLARQEFRWFSSAEYIMPFPDEQLAGQED